MKSARVVEVLHDRGETASPRWLLGSGFLAKEYVVVTAAHNLGDDASEIGPEGTVVRCLDGTEHAAATILARSDMIDLALLLVPGLKADQISIGRIDRTNIEVVRDVMTAGFPNYKYAKDKPKAQRRQPAQPVGWVGTVEDLPGGDFTLKLESAEPAQITTGKGSPWEGFSGAGVIVSESLVGIAIEHYPTEGLGSIRFVPFTRLGDEELPEVDRLLFCAILGISNPLQLPTINPPPEQVARASAITPPAPITPPVDKLLDEILAADEVDIIGILPWQCARRLLEREADRRRAGQSVIRPTAVRYFTPSSNTMKLYRHSYTMGPLVQRWIAGTTGLRNWLRPEISSPPVSDALALFEFDDVYIDCLVRTRHHAKSVVTMLSQLPPSSPGRADEKAVLVITRTPARQSAECAAYVKTFESRARQTFTHEILCDPASKIESGSPASGNEFRPIFKDLWPRRTLRPAFAVSPAAIVAICAETESGSATLLQHRTERNSVDDLGVLSLISGRVLEEDLSARSPSGTFEPDPRQRIHRIWRDELHRPRPFEIPEWAFRQAARRELIFSCGLDIPDERLELCGTCLVEREREDTYLGFFIYRLDLILESGKSNFDEVQHARSWNPDLREILIDDLYADKSLPLNRLLRHRRTFIRKAVFKTP